MLTAQNRKGLLRFPFTIHASDQTPRLPDFLIEDPNGSRGLEVTEAGDRQNQEWMTDLDRNPGTETILVPGDGWTPGHISRQIREAIERKVRKYDEGAYQANPCDLVVYNNTEDVVDDVVVNGVRDPCVAGRFGHVHLLCGHQVFMDVLTQNWSQIDLRQDYDIDACSWIVDQIHELRGNWSHLDVDNLIKELDALARRDRRALGSRLENLFAHLLLKWHHQPAGRSGKLAGHIDENCARLDDLLAESPCLRNRLDPEGEAVATAYRRARSRATNETGLGMADFPTALPWRAELSDVARGARSLEATFGSLADKMTVVANLSGAMEGKMPFLQREPPCKSGPRHQTTRDPAPPCSESSAHPPS